MRHRSLKNFSRRNRFVNIGSPSTFYYPEILREASVNLTILRVQISAQNDIRFQPKAPVENSLFCITNCATTNKYTLNYGKIFDKFDVLCHTANLKFGQV